MSTPHDDRTKDEFEPDDVADQIAQLVAQDPAIALHEQAQEEALEGLECTNQKTFGHWVDAYDVPYLLAAFDLPDPNFGKEFPEMAHLTEADRQQILKAFGLHMDSCPRCSVKRRFDEAYYEKQDRVFMRKRDEISQMLEAKDE